MLSIVSAKLDGSKLDATFSNGIRRRVDLGSVLPSCHAPLKLTSTAVTIGELVIPAKAIYCRGTTPDYLQDIRT